MKKFNFSHIIRVASISVFFEALFMVLCIPIALIYKEKTAIQFTLLSIAVLTASGLVIIATHKRPVSVSVKDNMLSVVAAWVMISIVGTLPYLITNSIPEFVNAVFESVSGFTTTGSSILPHIEGLPKSVLFWRAETHWLGGMGVIVLVIAFLPFFKIGGHQMMVAEGSFFSTEKIKARTIDVAKRMWFIYVILTAAETIALKIAGMSLFDAVCHSFATVATGGFSTKDSSLINVSPAIQYIVIVFMILSGMNFTLHYMFAHRKFKRFFSDEEMRTYIAIILISSGLITYSIVKHLNLGVEYAFRQSLFQIASIITATGFVSADYSLWTPAAKMIILIVMLIGACAGSTGGGIKVARYLIVFKNMRQYIRKIIKPTSIQITRYNGNPIPFEISIGIIGFIFIYYGTIVFGSLIMMLTGLDDVSAISSIITTLGGIGPGFRAVGPVENFSGLSEFGKYYLSFNMLLGRLEIMSVLTLFIPSFYKR